MGASERRYKIEQVVDKYGLDTIGDELASRWLGEGSETASLRELAEYFNRRVLRTEMEAAGMSTMDTDVERAYRNLTDDVSSGTRTETRRRFERAGVDVDELLSDFVSYQAVRTYLREVRDVEYDGTNTLEPDRAIKTVERLQGRTASVTEDRIRRLDDAGRIDVGDIRLIVNVNAICEQCGTQFDAAELIRRGGCDCEA